MDFKNNDNWAKPGFPIKIKDIALGCAMNIEKIKVKKKPKVAILSTGDELVNIGKKTKDFQIISSSSIALKTLIESFGANVTDLGICKDNKLLIKNKIKNIESLNIDTFDINNNFFSARRALRLNHDDYGRNISIIMLN